jgi:hypothetical protein
MQTLHIIQLFSHPIYQKLSSGQRLQCAAVAQFLNIKAEGF